MWPVFGARMWRNVLIFGVVGGALIALLKWSEYQFLVVEHSFELYAGLVAAIFAALGIWLGNRLTARRTNPVVIEPVVTEPVVTETAVELPVAAAPASVAEAFMADEGRREELGITRRELEVLELMAQGMSNREIAESLFVSENTVKTHSSRVFEKLGAKRRTQAVQMGKEQGLLQ